jgi:hypothetical protein
MRVEKKKKVLGEIENENHSEPHHAKLWKFSDRCDFCPILTPIVLTSARCGEK